MHSSNFLYQNIAVLYIIGIPRSKTEFQWFWPDIHTGRDRIETEELAGYVEDTTDDND